MFWPVIVAVVILFGLFLLQREKADTTKDKAMRDAGITLIRWHVKNMPDVTLIRETVRQRLTQH